MKGNSPNDTLPNHHLWLGVQLRLSNLSDSTVAELYIICINVTFSVLVCLCVRMSWRHIQGRRSWGGRRGPLVTSSELGLYQIQYDDPSWGEKSVGDSRFDEGFGRLALHGTACAQQAKSRNWNRSLSDADDLDTAASTNRLYLKCSVMQTTICLIESSTIRNMYCSRS